MTINGVNTLACITPLPPADDTSADATSAEAHSRVHVVIYPLPHLPVIKDLVCDLSHLYRQYAAIKPWLQTTSPPPCRRTGGPPKPSPTGQGGRWLTDSRDEAFIPRAQELDDSFALYRCHTIMNCTKTCPKGLNPAQAIPHIKRDVVGVSFTSLES
jgi:succinate dehydrogenase / fumarate reductase iron-sulfur subunit